MNFYNEISVIDDRSFIVDRNTNINSYNYDILSTSYISSVASDDASFYVTVQPGNCEKQIFKNLYFTMYNPDELDKSNKILCENQFSVTEYKDGEYEIVVLSFVCNAFTILYMIL